MATQAQIAANRRNAKKSTGPRTPQGKAKACRNHLSHGLTGEFQILPTENQSEFDALLAALIAEFRPATSLELTLVDRMATAHWLTLRALDFLTAAAPNALLPLMRYYTAADRAFYAARAALLSLREQKQNPEIGFESQIPALCSAAPRVYSRFTDATSLSLRHLHHRPAVSQCRNRHGRRPGTRRLQRRLPRGPDLLRSTRLQ